jgi:flagellar M-ring protein FliF
MAGLLGQGWGTRRFIQLGAGAAVVAGIWLLAHWASAPTFVTLYRDLDLSESGSIAENLAKTDIPYRLASGGAEVLVPAADIARARVTLAKAGLPTNGRPGLELFDKPDWGMTDFTERVTYQRALEGELARTIGALRGVSRAQVHLVLPSGGPLHRIDRPAGAAVVLTLKGGTTVSPETVRGITYIVSNSVEQLSSDNVAVMDDAGHVLSVPAATETAEGLTTRQLEIQRSVEGHLEDKIEGILATVVGTGRVRAQVSAQMSFDQVDRTTESFDPDGQVLQTEQRSESQGGNPGDSAGSQTVLSNAYQNSHKVEKYVGSVGNVSKLSIAVLVDEKALGTSGPGGKPLDTREIESVVRNAVGADSARGDRINVTAVPFEATPLAAGGDGGTSSLPKADPMRMVEKVSRPVVSVVAIVVLLLLAFRTLGSPAPRAAETDATVATNGTANGRALPAANGSEFLLGASRLPGESGARPEAAAQVMRAWMAERRN